VRLERWANLIAIGIAVLILAAVAVTAALVPEPIGLD
jgi:hypothetical protein